MAQTAMTVRVDNNIKMQFDSLCEQFGMSTNAAINVFINAVVRARAIPFKISVKEEDSVRQALLDALYAPHPDAPDMTMEEIDEEIRKARQERRERIERERQAQQKEVA
jgi:DNA-damage-inducible protein J